MNAVLRTSEFWMGLITGAGWLLSQFGVVPQSDFAQFLAPALVYILGRVVSKTAKKAVPSG